MSVRMISLKPAAWPPKDQAAWSAACRPGDFLEPGGGAAGWREVSRKNIAKSYGVWIGFLAGRGELDPAPTPADRVTRESVVGYVEHLMTINKLSSVAGRIRDLSEALRVMAPRVDWTWLRRLLSNLRRMTNDRSKPRRPLPTSRDLYDLGLRLMQRAESDLHLKRRRAALYADGLMIATLAAVSIRKRNLQQIEIGRHLVKRGEVYHLGFEAHEMKNHRQFSTPLPAELTRHIDRYIDYYRPLLVTQNGSRPAAVTAALWISSRATPMAVNTIHDRIIKVTKRELGESINPHSFRRILATTVATEDPVHVGIAGTLLGHSRFETTDKYYIMARDRDAGRKYQAVLDRRRYHHKGRK